jgi:hypothetical protein
VAGAPGVEIEGLKEFRAALRASGTGLTRELSKAIRAAGKPPLARVKVLAGRTSSSPRSTGDLARSYKVRTAGASGYLQSGVPYGAGAEWGVYGKWSGFRRKYPGPEPGGRGRFAWRAVKESDDEIMAVITGELERLIEIQGWAREA